MPAIVREEGKLQLRDEDVVDLVIRVHGAGAGDEVVAPGQGFGADEFQQKPRHCAIIVPEHDELAGKCLHGTLIEYLTLGRDGGEQPQLLGAGALGARQHPGAQTLDVAAHLIKIGTACLGPAAVQKQTARRSDIPRRPAAQDGVAGKQRFYLVGVQMQLFGVDGMIQAHHHLIRSRGIRLHHVGRGGVHNDPVLPGQDHAVQTVRVAGTVDALGKQAVLLCSTGQPLHQSGFAAARPAFDQVHLHPGFAAQRFKVALEPGGCGGTQKKINGIVPCGFHN